MNSFRRIIGLFLVFFIIFNQGTPLFAQTPTGSMPPSDSGRLSGSSFGSKVGGGALPGVSGVSDRIMNLQGTPSTYGGLAEGLTYQVHILGEVNKPGTYRITASTRVSEALEKAGGVLDRGSERSIELRRMEGRARKIDLLSFKTFGNLDENPYLLDNDVVFVPLKGKVVRIEGTIKRPGTYELKTETSLEDLVRLAGGFTPGVGDSAPIKVVRFHHQKKELIDVENLKGPRNEFMLENADVIVVPHFLTEKKVFDYNLNNLPGDNELFYPSYEERVFVLGSVSKPGPYPFSPYYDVRQYLTFAGGATKLAKDKKMKVIRVDGKIVKATAQTEINPGDTIIVPEKYLAPENALSLVLGLTTSILGITTTVLTLTR